MSISFAAHQGTPASTTFYVSQALTGTLTIEFSQNAKFGTIALTKTTTPVAGKVTVALTGAEVDSLKDAHFRVKDSNGRVVETGIVDYVVAEQQPLTATDPALSAIFGKRGAPNVAAPLLIVTPVTITKTGTKSAVGQDPATGLFYGSDTSNGHFITSPDLITWTDRTYSPSTFTPNLIAMAFDSTYMYGYSSDGRIWRAAKGVFNIWTEITVASKGPLTTGRPGSLCALGNGVLLYGNYTSAAGDGSHIWRSTNAGASWTEVLGRPSGKHVHCIRQNPADGTVWATLGDATFDSCGLWKSIDQGATWTLMSNNDYGIDMVFVPSREGRPALVVMEGDGLNRPHLMGFPQDGKPGDKTYPLVWFTGAPTDPATTRGTVRGICLLPTEDILYWTTTESGAVGVHSGIYVAQAPYYTRTVLLADTTGAEPVAYSRTLVSGGIVQNRTWTISTPAFGAY